MICRRVAAIDIGTVTTRLLIADVRWPRHPSPLDCTTATVTEIERSTDITHLGEDLARTGALSPSAMERVRAVIERYTARLDAHGVEAWGAVATSASRDAENGSEFLGLLEHAGIRPEIIAGPHEATLSFLGATHGMNVIDVLVDDIGGGSTELILGSAGGPDGTHIELARSFDVGSRRATEALITTDPPSDSQMIKVRSAATHACETFFTEISRPVRDVVSVAGTPTSLVSVLLEMETYDPAVVHGYRLTLDQIRATRIYLAGMTLEQRSVVTGLHPGRAPVIVAGALILEAVLEAAGVDSTLVSERDILYGILLEVAGSSACGSAQVGSGSG